MIKQRPYLSIIFPAYNEEKRLPTAINQVVRFCQVYSGPVEVIVVENGSTDKTAQVAIETMLDAARLDYLTFAGKLIRSRPGKGAAVKKGILNSSGSVVLITDVDLSTPLSEAFKFIDDIEKGYQFIIGSRKIDGALVTGRSFKRSLAGLAFHLLTSTIVPGIRDTQCGFKVISGPLARSIAPKLTVAGFAYDVELIYLAAFFRAARFKERPVIWTHDENSTVKLFKDSLNMARDIKAIGQNIRNGVYSFPSPP